MAKSMRSKSKRAFRRTKREEGVYAAAHAARLERLSAKLVAKVSEDKDGDQAMEGEEEKVEDGGGKRLSIVWYQSRGVTTREELSVLRLALDDIRETVTGGEKNLNNTDEPRRSMTDSSLVYDGDGDVQMADLYPPMEIATGEHTLMDNGDIEMMVLDSGYNTETEDPLQSMSGPNMAMDTMGVLCMRISQLSIEDPRHDRIARWCLQVSEAYEEEEDDDTESELITPKQPLLDDPEVWQQDEPLFPSEDPVSQAGRAYPLDHAHPPSGADAKYSDYPPLFQEDFRYEAPR